MEVYTLDPLLRRMDLIEDYESCIWTDRYKQSGDFEIKIASSRRTRSLLVPGLLLATDVTHTVMRIESTEDAVDEEGRKMLDIKGRSIETVLYDRAAVAVLDDTTTAPNWTITGLTAMNAARKIFHDICVTGTLDANDIIPFINEGSFTASSNIPEPADIVTVEIDPTTVYDAIFQLADVWDFGFRILRQGDMSKLWFDVYTGSDRTTGQSILPAVVFSPQLDNLQNTKELVSAENAKNVAYVFSPAGYLTVYADDVDPDIAGFERRVLVVNATDITDEAYPTAPEVTAALLQKGNEELSKARTYHGFDGELSQASSYLPGRDYNLGDLIEMRNDDGVTNNMRVSEIIYASDQEGYRSYPSLELNRFINTGAWLSYLYNKKWIEMGSDTWSEQP